MKRKYLVALLAVVIACFLLVSLVYAAQPITLIVNGQTVQCDVPPQLINGRTMVPISAVAKALGCQVNWDGNTQAVNIASSAGSNASGLEYYFPRAGQHPDQELINVINSAKSNLDIAIYSLTKDDIVQAIAAAKGRGATVRIISDKEESDNKYQAQALATLASVGIPIKINHHSGLMHMKVTIADDSTVTTGSYNYTNEATDENDEVLVIIHDSTVAQNFDNEFQSMWSDNKNYIDFK
jgi:phosphatidylserine/phosphatidylglycerophosphate/cardiolipin synthase-like enzyme